MKAEYLVVLEKWTPKDPLVDALPPHRLLYDAEADEIRVEWLSDVPGDWYPCYVYEHVPVIGGGR